MHETFCSLANPLKTWNHTLLSYEWIPINFWKLWSTTLKFPDRREDKNCKVGAVAAKEMAKVCRGIFMSRPPCDEAVEAVCPQKTTQLLLTWLHFGFHPNFPKSTTIWSAHFLHWCEDNKQPLMIKSTSWIKQYNFFTWKMNFQIVLV